MRIEGSEQLDVSPDQAWGRLTDLRSLAEALPGAELLDARSEDAVEARFALVTGLGVTPLRARFEVADRDEGGSFAVRGVGGAGETAIRLLARFELRGEARSELAWELDLHVFGVLRSLGQRTIADLARAQVGAVIDSVNDSVVSAP